MKKIILLTLFSGSLNALFAQTSNTESTLSSLAKLDLGLQGIGVTYEPRLSNKMTVDLSAGAGGGYDIGEGALNIDYLKPALYLMITPKYFYNRQKRILNGKKSQLNSGNYIGLRLKYVTPNDRQSDYTRNSILVNIHWGIQRAISNRWTFGAHAGAGYAQDIDYNFGTIYPAIDCKFSYILANLKQ